MTDTPKVLDATPAVTVGDGEVTELIAFFDRLIVSHSTPFTPEESHWARLKSHVSRLSAKLQAAVSDLAAARAERDNAEFNCGHEYERATAAESALSAMTAERDEALKELRSLTCAPEPRAFDFETWTDWLRLLREVRGYMHTCWRQHDGGDRKGRQFAQDGLQAMEKKITALRVQS